MKKGLNSFYVLAQIVFFLWRNCPTQRGIKDDKVYIGSTVLSCTCSTLSGLEAQFDKNGPSMLFPIIPSHHLHKQIGVRAGCHCVGLVTLLSYEIPTLPSVKFAVICQCIILFSSRNLPFSVAQLKQLRHQSQFLHGTQLEGK